MFNGFTAQDVDLPTGRIHYRIGGAGDAVLLLHGFPQTHAMWAISRQYWRRVSP